ncbi:glycosyltransferase family 2 protein [Paracidobacterium acidisoli]|uniref:Glycosyltransferase family 2 protein n=1 Tax=Paracidobacterium acidisoli TaxID=2303751 RepID=A0A372IRP5_9BACT|nr:glycosyltransferase family 2 protein [Paracidobacterium acidisoli]MBT9330459.1 glycosyltransferase [Paracidobacterium acidisoli]
MTSELPLVSVLFVTYKRFDLLAQTVEAFRRNTDYPSLELVIADDGSGEEIQAKIRTLPADLFALAPRNQGLGANNNNGIRHCTGKYIFMVQDDWVCQGPRDYLRQAIQVMEENPQVGLINFGGAPHPADKNMRLSGSSEPCYATPKPYEDGRIEYFLYSDQPHIQSRAALDHVGLYKEDRDMEECEIDYNHRWKNQTAFLTAVFPAWYMKAFSNEGQQQSFRTTRFRYKVQGFLQPAKPMLEKFAPGLVRSGKQMVQSTLRWLERRGVVR